jgi:hypothetical protein
MTINKTLDICASFKGELAEQVDKDKTELGVTWNRLILEGIKALRASQEG